MKYAGLIENDVVNGGDGVAVSLFCQGCPHRCKGCFNPETWDYECGKEITKQALINKVIKAIDKNGVIRNLSILGGEPLCDENIHVVEELIHCVKNKFKNIKVWLWTGYKYEDISNLSILNSIDVIVDGKFDIDKKDITLPYRGSTNQRVIDVQKTLFANKIVIRR